MEFTPHNLDNLQTRINSRGYVMAMVKGHPTAQCDGYVRVHRLVMENALGRFLKRSELVHHIDGDITNNDISNLELMESNREHALHHRTPPPVRKCAYCGKEFTITKRSGSKYVNRQHCSKKCTTASRAEKTSRANKGIARTGASRPSKEYLERLVWEMPSTEIAKLFSVSGKTIEHWCKHYGIEKPGRGYWAKVKRESKPTVVAH